MMIESIFDSFNVSNVTENKVAHIFQAFFQKKSYVLLSYLLVPLTCQGGNFAIT